MFSWDNPLGTISSPTVLRNCHWWSHFLTKTQEQDYNQQLKTLLYSITDVFTRVFWGLFWNRCTKKLWKLYSKRMEWVLLWIKLRGYSLLPTTGPKTLLKITFLGVLWNHRKTVPFISNISPSKIESSFIVIRLIWIFVGNIAAFCLDIMQELEIFVTFFLTFSILLFVYCFIWMECSQLTSINCCYCG